MIFSRALRREFNQVAGAVFVTLFTVLATTQSIRLLGNAATGRLASEAVFPLLGFSALSYLPVLLSLTVFLSVLLAISRQYRDSEMVVWFASGQPLTAWIRPVLVFTLPFLIIISALSFLVSPWAVRESERYKAQLSARDDAARIAPGTFRESGSGERVFFVENVAGDATSVQNVFVSALQQGRMGVIVSKRGSIQIAENGDKFMVMQDGRRYEGEPGKLDFKIMEFERYSVRVEQSGRGAAPESSPKQLATAQLLADRTNPNKGEFLWRIGVPLSTLTLALLAIPLAFVNPRAGRSVNLIFAFLVYLFYSNCISITQAWVAQGRVGFHSAWWLVHVAMAALLLILFWRRLAVGSILRSLVRT